MSSKARKYLDTSSVSNHMKVKQAHKKITMSEKAMMASSGMNMKKEMSMKANMGRKNR